jgi:hypothetical protein
MSLVKKPVMTEKNLSAHRRNAQQSRGTTTPEGKERGRAANLRHGVYSQIQDEALVALGEDPAQLSALVDGAHERWQPANHFQGWIVERLARLQWRIQRADRMQESLAAERVERVLKPLRAAAQEIRRRYAPQADFLDLRRHDVARPDFYAQPGYFRDFAEAFEGISTKSLTEIHRLLHRLRKPRQFPPGAEPVPPEATSDEDWHDQLEEMEAVKFPIPHPKIRVAEGAEREALRQELLQVVITERKVAEMATEELLEENENSLSPFERDRLASSVDGQSDLLRRQEESCFRQFWRMGSFLMKIQDRGGRAESEVHGQESEVRSPKSEVQAQETELDALESEARSQIFTAIHENEGASGDVDENTGSEIGEGMTDCRTSLSSDRLAASPLPRHGAEEGVETAEMGSEDRLPAAEGSSHAEEGAKKAELDLPAAA